MAERLSMDRGAELLAAFGADLKRWPDATAAGETRARLLSDRDFRRAWEREGSFDRALHAEAAEIDRRIADSGAMERLAQRTLAAVQPLPFAGFGWSRIAAALALAVVLGGTADMLFAARSAAEASPVLVVDNLLFGPDAVEL